MKKIRRCKCCGIDQHLCHGLAQYLRAYAILEGHCRLDHGRLVSTAIKPPALRTTAYVGQG